LKITLNREDYGRLLTAVDYRLSGLNSILRLGSRYRGSMIIQELRVLARTTDKSTADLARYLAASIMTAEVVEIEVMDAQSIPDDLSDIPDGV
jgi:hypothetical protein